MIQLRTLGKADLVSTDAPGLAEVCGRPKVLALLAYLALARPRGFHSQDSLLAMFWPESDTARAQLSLRQSVHILRRALGEQAIVRRGRSELGLADHVLQCDAIEFERALSDGRCDDALALYAGDLLPAFYVFDAPDFERWLAVERRRLHDLAVDAARARVDELRLRTERKATERKALVRVARQWVAFSPTDEHAIVTLMDALADMDDCDAALAVFETYTARLRDDGEAPTVTARACLGRVHERKRLGSPARTPATSVAADESASVQPVPPSDTMVHPTTRTLRPARRGRHLSGAIVAAVALVALGGVALRGRVRASGEPTLTRLAVLPFTVRAEPREGYWREGMVDLLSAKLDGAGGLVTVDPRLVLAFAQSHTGDADHTAQIQAAARELRAALVVTGTVVGAGSRGAVTAIVYDSTGRRLANVESTAADEAAMLGAVDEIARGVVASQLSAASRRLERVAATTTTSFEALKAFLEGERAVRAGQSTRAIDAFGDAVRIDSTFALAHYRLSTAALWSTQSALVSRSIELALRFAHRLPRRERLALEARMVVKRGAADEADRMYRQLVATYPDDLDAWNQLGELLFHTGPWRGHPLSDARPAFEQVLTLQPDNTSAMLHLARLAALERRTEDVKQLVERALASNPDRDAALELNGLRAAVTRDPGERARLLDSLRVRIGGNSLTEDVSLLAWRVATYTDDPRQGERLASALIDVRNASEVQRVGHATLAHMFGARGAWAQAERELVAIEQQDSVYAAEMRANFALVLPRALNDAGRRRTRAILARAAQDAAVPRFAGASDPDRMRAVRVTYLAGTLALAERDSVDLLAQERRLMARAAGPSADAELAGHLAAQLRARARLAGGDVDGALREVERGWPSGSPRASLPLYQGDGYTHGHERYFRGQLLALLGRDEEALRWLSSVADDQGESLVLSAAVHVARARVAAHRGDSSLAAAERARAVALASGTEVALGR